MRLLPLPAALAAAVLVLAGCSVSAPAPAPASSNGGGAVIHVVAAENFWGSIAAQLGGSHVQVTSIIDSPDADPHEYEPTAADARAIATADLVLINGVGYDAWATKLAAANPAPQRVSLTVGELVGVAEGGNPHRWYNPDDVQRVIDELTRDYQRLDPSAASYFTAQKASFEMTALAEYRSTIASIKATYAGTPVGASESIVAMFAPALGLDLITPADFLLAISEGTDPSAADKATIDAQFRAKKLKVYIYNAQNATPDIQTQVAEATAEGIPVTSITETMTPATASWQQWQTAQLVSLRTALAKATGR